MAPFSFFTLQAQLFFPEVTGCAGRHSRNNSNGQRRSFRKNPECRLFILPYFPAERRQTSSEIKLVPSSVIRHYCDSAAAEKIEKMMQKKEEDEDDSDDDLNGWCYRKY